jgi:hypothetical protein
MIRISSQMIGIFPIKMNHPLYRHIESQSDRLIKKNNGSILFLNRLFFLHET